MCVIAFTRFSALLSNTNNTTQELLKITDAILKFSTQIMIELFAAICGNLLYREFT